MLPILRAHPLPLPPSAPVVSPRPWPPAPRHEAPRGRRTSRGRWRCRGWRRRAAGHEEGTAGTLLGHETQAYRHRCPMLFGIFDNILVIMLHFEMDEIDQIVCSKQWIQTFCCKTLDGRRGYSPPTHINHQLGLTQGEVSISKERMTQ